MNSRDRRESFDAFEVMIRQGLHTRAGEKLPRPELRRELLQRAGRQPRRAPWRLPVALPSLFSEPDYVRQRTAENHMLYLESLFGLRLGWFSYNQLMR